MNNMLRYVVYILLFLLYRHIDQDHYTVEPTDLHPQTSCYQQQQDPCKKNSGLPVYQQFCRYATNSHIT